MEPSARLRWTRRPQRARVNGEDGCREAASLGGRILMDGEPMTAHGRSRLVTH